MLTACLSMMLHLLLLLIRIAIKLRLSIPLVYLVLMLTAFRPWYRAHTAFADGIFLALVGCTVLSWIISCVAQTCNGCAVSLQNRTRWHDAPYRWRVTAIRCGCCSTRSMSRCMMTAVSEISLHCLSFQRSCRIC